MGCVNSIAKALEARARDLVKGTVEDIIAFPHPYGCSQMGDDQENTRKVLADMIHHPNAGGVLVLGLGCENSNIPVLMDYIGEYDAQRVKFLQCQDVEDEMETAMEMLEELAEYAGAFSREQIDASELIDHCHILLEYQDCCIPKRLGNPRPQNVRHLYICLNGQASCCDHGLL